MHFDLITVVAPGWVELSLSGDEPRPRVLVKVEDRDGRGVITSVVVTGDRLDSTTLKSIPVARIEAALNHPKLGIPRVQIDPEALQDLAAHGHLFPDEFRVIDEALATYLQKAPQPSGTKRQRPQRRQRHPLTRPDGTDPEGFYQRVAEAYNDLIVTTAAPAPLLAEEAGVPVPTVHRWIAEARRRGFLPQARRGRVG